MHKSKKIIVLLFSMIFCISLFSLTASAAKDGDCIDGSLLTHEKEAKDFQPFSNNLFNPGISTYGTYLSGGTAYIQNEGNGVVYIAGETTCYSTCQTASVTLYLQKLVNGSWQTVTSRSHTSTNTNYSYYGLPLAVQTGYYYRVKGAHTVTQKGVTETTYTETSGLYIG